MSDECVKDSNSIAVCSFVSWKEVTPHLKFIDGILHQCWMVHGTDESGFASRNFEWQPVPSESSREEEPR